MQRDALQEELGLSQRLKMTLCRGVQSAVSGGRSAVTLTA